MRFGTFGARGRRLLRPRQLAAALAVAVAVPTTLAPIAAAAEALGRPGVPDQHVSKVHKASPGAKKLRKRVAAEKAADTTRAERATAERRTSWPKPGESDVALARGKHAAATPGGLPVRLAPATGKKNARAAAGTATVAVLDQKTVRRAGLTGVLLTATAQNPGSAELSVDYSSFAGAVGGDWGRRLHLVQLPACALTTPRKAECREQTPLATANDVTAHTLSATVPLGAGDAGVSTQAVASATVLAVTASGGGAATGSGDYTATPLAESSSWQAGAGSGAFTWSHDFDLPPAAAGPSPELSLSYDSAGIDGRTAGTNNQGTTVGEGFSLTGSYVERSYGSCDKDGHSGVHDQCWKYDNATLVLNGSSTQLVKDDDTGHWHLAGDDASKVTRSTGADNGDDDGEYWTVVTGDGTKYVFGLDKLDGADNQRTHSTWTVPVFGDDSGEPGYSKGSAFADRSVAQAWRWNLDYVEDPHGNAVTYWYTKESNHYAKNNASTANAAYVRGGYLKEIDYGLRAGALFTDKPDAKVTFSHAERCTASDCTSLTKDTAENWPDVPFDAICAKGADDCYATAPSFFTRKRLTGIDTFSWNASSAAFDPVDSWALKQKYLDGGDIGDSSDQVLTLTSLRRTAKAGTPLTQDPVTFTYQMRPNRVDATDDVLPLTRPRVSTITSETGAITTVTLSAPECTASQVAGAAEDTNTRPCYPQYWNVNGATEASVDWFHKYRVEAVVTTDPTGGNEPVENAYSYAGAAWRHSDAPFTPADERTWSDWRGYRQVTVYSGATGSKRTKRVSLYLQGMDGDKNKDGSTKSVNVAPLSSPALGAATVKDSEQYQGRLREEVTYDGDTAITATVEDPWSKETARQTVPGAPDAVARFVDTVRTTSYTYLTVPEKWRSTSTTKTFDSYGMVSTVEDGGDTTKTGDETCTRTWYARNTSANLLDAVSRTRVVAATCATPDKDLDLPANSATRGDVLSDTVTVYDDADATAWNAGQKPAKGDATWTGRAAGYPAGANPDGDRDPNAWATLSRDTFDALGRTLSSTDADGNTSSTTYTPAGAGPLTKTIATDAKGFRTATFLDPRRGTTLRSYDPNLKKTESTYDALGRLTAVWQPNRNKAAGQAASATFAYHLDNSAPSWVSTSTLKADGTTYNTSYQLYDSMLRELQTQTPSPRGGRILTDTRYDSRGKAYETYANIYDSTTAPSGTYTRADYGEAPRQTQTSYDGAGRTTATSLYVYGAEKWTVTTSYTGDSSATSAVAGGSATRNIFDVRGRTVETREYAGTSPTDIEYGGGLAGSGYAPVKYAFSLDDKKTAITGPDGAEWTYAYDLFGRQTTTHDPDAGTSTTVYDELDQPVKVTDARDKAVLTDYDELGRVTATYSGSRSDAHQLTAHTYDSLLKGMADSTVRYVGGSTGDAYTQKVTAYDSLSRPTGTSLTLPADDPLVGAGTPRTLEFEKYYNIDGTQQNYTEPALGGLSAETVEYGYDDLGAVESVTGASGYVRATDYSATGQVQQLTLGTGGSGAKNAYVTQTWDEGTGRLLRSHVTDQTHAYMLQDLTYGYDDAGNVTSIADPATLGGSESAETQCFAYDGHRRLTEAWTPASQKCSDDRGTTALGGPSPYWTSWSYNAAGQRAKQVEHTASGMATTAYCYGADQPHTLTGTSTTDCTLTGASYAYDATGNTTRRPAATGTGTQTLDWSDEGRLSKVSAGDTDTDYLYAADGTLLIRATQNGDRVLYAGTTELHLKADGTTWAERSYGAGSMTVAFRTNQSGKEKLFFTAGDQHGTQSLAIASDTQAVVKRRSAPFGADRGTTTGGDWPTDKGFLGKPVDDSTGLTHIGAREYDASTGQFLSVDPVLDVTQPQSLNGYSYADNSPVTMSDPDGLRPLGPTDGGTTADNKWAKDRGMDAGYTYEGGKWNWKQTPKKDKESRKRYAAYQASPTHYLIDDSAARKRATQAAAARQKALAEKANKEAAEQRKKDGVLGNLFKGNFSAAWDNAKSDAHAYVDAHVNAVMGAIDFTKEHWRGMLQVGAFVVCVAASAGWCLAAGAAVFVANNAKAIGNGQWNSQMTTDALFTLAGFGAAGALGRATGSTWRAAFTSSAVARSSGGAFDAARTYVNMSTNAKMALVGCGVGGFSPSYCTR
ncbi:RHS repeat-associated core domain-containing protein [Streptomyces sp. NBC_00726]|uniref:RHS repeat-associated core domain-containing protein n=1 Tax=Streptomyces sp. NBC_00726 TaxID=2903674 RepID=UPI0038671BF3